MLSIFAFGMVATFMTLIMTKRMSAMIALIIVPTVFALIAGFSVGLGEMMLTGIRDIAPTGVMLLFAILYFGIMIDAGLFDPLTRKVVELAHGDPLRITMGSAILGLIVALDGDGTTTYMITLSALLPLYRHMKMDVRVLTCILIMAVAAMNLVPWGGPTARAAIALGVDPRALFLSLIPPVLTTVCWVLFAAWMLGRAERKRLGITERVAMPPPGLLDLSTPDSDGTPSTRRPRLYWFNAALTAALMGVLLFGDVPLQVLFMVAFAIAVMVNYPQVDMQRERIAAHASNALATAGLVFAAGIFTGVLSGTMMVDAMANTVTGVIPDALGPYMAPITALVSIPFTVLISNDAFYFGMLPVLAHSAENYGITAMEVARASLVGQQIHLLSPLVASTYLLVATAGVELGDHQRFTMKWALGACAVFMITCLVLGLFPWHA
ncbi:CitMHS family transporter [Sphingosinicella soli]|uniref:CitMHS family citrate-Mg2+:H+ or citrate-Ca2+:H+ symporter n=1 Tax=Sphingosinicella soli TaxID=333708 RepID=A0A7W7B112_9SPHN|nr:citrate:proton symporter [Sphingosinicella soli]MBB4632068.1 CitMHS family citrate-Mg2+:H+ or citrate-Ca2+:H+ symporter [Sphingosinicella soli]